MPEICRFFGIVITMNYNDHNPPHFHARYGSDDALFTIEPLALYSGELTPRAVTVMFYDIVRVSPLAGHRLHLTFRDGVEGDFDVGKEITFTSVFEPLLEEAEFRKVRVNTDIGTIEWPNDVDLDPIVLYAAVTGRTIEDVLASNAVR